MVEMRRGAYRIGELAREAGVSVQAVRFYERRRLLPAPLRTESGHRRYGPDALELLRIIRRAQDLGFTLKDVAGLLEARAHPDAPCVSLCRVLRLRLDQLERQIRELTALRRRLTRLRNACATVRPIREAPLLKELEGRGSKKRRRSS